MKLKRRFYLIRLNFVILTATCFLTSAAAQSSSATSNASGEDIKPLVVMIEATLQGAPSRGAGIICGVGSDSLYIVTANHVVRKGQHEAQDIELQFKWLPGIVIKGQLLRQRDSNLDLAVLRVEGLAQLKLNVENLPFDRLGSRSQRPGADIYLLGYPNGKPWRINTTSDKFAETRGDSLEFESNLIAGGHSGGALLDGNHNVIGMLRSDTAPYGEAINIFKVIQRLADWGYPVNLGFPTIPTKFSMVEVGYGKLCALSTSGAVFCFGDIESYSNSRDVSEVFSVSPVRVRGGLTFSSISGTSHHCGVTTSGDGYCWGKWISSAYPVLVSPELKFRTVSAGYHTAFGVTTDDGVYYIDDEKPSRVSGGLAFRAVGVKSGWVRGVTLTGEIYRLPVEEGSKPIPGNLKFSQFDGLCGLTTDGAAYFIDAEHDNQAATLTRMPHPRALSFSTVRGGGGRCCGVDTRGAIYCRDWPSKSGAKITEAFYQVAEANGPKFSSVSTYRDTYCGVTARGDLYCWGRLVSISGAKEVYGDVPVRMPRDAYLQSVRSVRLFRLEGDFNRAWREVEAAINAYPNEGSVKQMHALVLADLGKPDQAVTEFRKLLNGEKDREIHLEIARTYRRARNYAEMERSLQLAEKLSKTAEEQLAINFQRAFSYSFLGKYEQAEAEYRRFLTANPDSAVALNNLGYMLVERNVRLEEAQELISKALKAEPSNSSTLDSMGLVFDRLGKLEEAETYFRRAWETSGPEAVVAEHLGDVYFKRGKIQEAIASWGDALQACEKSAPIDIDPAQVGRLRKKLESVPKSPAH